jgi:hypothetical protein
MSKSFLRIVDAADNSRDDVTIEEIDRLASEGVPTRRAFLSEMLCLRFPDLFPVINEPVQKYLAHAGFKELRGASEGARYLYLARTLRFSLVQAQDHPANTLAELDTVIWVKFGKRQNSQ